MEDKGILQRRFVADNPERTMILAVAAAATLCLYIVAQEPQPSNTFDGEKVYGEDEVNIMTEKGTVFHLNVSDNRSERAKGLMNTENLVNDGMIFAFNKSSERTFWMKNTLIPLQIIYLDSRGAVLGVDYARPQPNASEPELDIYRSPSPARYVVEIPQTSRSNGTDFRRFTTN